MPSQKISAFTLSLILGACGGDEGKKDDSESSGGSSSKGGTETGDGSGEESSSKKTTNEETSGSESSSESGSEETSGSESGSEETSGEVSQLCQDYALKLVECDPEYTTEEFEQYCEINLDYYEQYYGKDCRSAVEDYFACLTKLDCEEIDTGCTAEVNQLDKVCTEHRKSK